MVGGVRVDVGDGEGEGLRGVEVGWEGFDRESQGEEFRRVVFLAALSEQRPQPRGQVHV